MLKKLTFCKKSQIYKLPLASAITYSKRRSPRLKDGEVRLYLPVYAGGLCANYRCPPVNYGFYNSYKPYGLTTLKGVERRCSNSLAFSPE